MLCEVGNDILSLQMATATQSFISIKTVGELLDRLGGIPADRVRFHPIPGSAVEQDLLDLDAKGDRRCELVDGTLVEKPMGLEESVLAIIIASVLREFVIPRNLGLVAGETGMFRLFPGCIRMPDVAYACHARRKGRPITQPAPDMAPDLAVEVLSESNTAREMKKKRDEYFSSGVKLVWMFDPRKHTVAVYTGPGTPIVLQLNDTLDGSDVLPGFTLPIKPLFDEMYQQLGARPPYQAE
jgi:Uma2 family endonuclease